jgi:hypothetical protein
MQAGVQASGAEERSFDFIGHDVMPLTYLKQGPMSRKWGHRDRAALVLVCGCLYRTAYPSTLQVPIEVSGFVDYAKCGYVSGTKNIRIRDLTKQGHTQVLILKGYSLFWSEFRPKNWVAVPTGGNILPVKNSLVIWIGSGIDVIHRLLNIVPFRAVPILFVPNQHDLVFGLSGKGRRLPEIMNYEAVNDWTPLFDYKHGALEIGPDPSPLSSPKVLARKFGNISSLGQLPGRTYGLPPGEKRIQRHDSQHGIFDSSVFCIIGVLVVVAGFASECFFWRRYCDNS